MPAIGFICEDGFQIDFESCFKECRMKECFETGRCLPLRTLRLMAKQRPWVGVPSVTQLLNGTRIEWLKIKYEYFFSPQSRAFAIVGTKSHAALEEFEGDDELGEVRLYLDGISGQFDAYVDGKLEDTKTYGSYKVAKFMGYKKQYIPTGEFYKSGAKKGQEKTKGIVVQGRRDDYNETLQLNMYRIMLEDAGFPVDQMNLDIYVRDGGVQAAQARGVDKLIYYVTMPRLPDEEVLSYFMGKKVALLEALENNEVPPMCSEEDRWGGIRCERYCDVARHCAGYCLKGAIDILIDAGHGGISLGDDEL